MNADNPPGDPVAVKPAPADDPPKSPKIVAKTPLKTPKELELEGRLKALQTSHSHLENKVDGLESALKETNAWLEGALPGGRPAAAPARSRKGILESVHDDLFRR